MSKLEQIQQRLINDYGHLIKAEIIDRSLHINYKGKDKATIKLCSNNYLRVYPESTWIDFKNVSSIIDYLKSNVIGE